MKEIFINVLMLIEVMHVSTRQPPKGMTIFLMYYNKMKNKNNITLSEQFQNPIENRRNRGKIDTPSTHIHDH